jgi:predicted polyphosphate/ATP-dependent NAD kinase
MTPPLVGIIANPVSARDIRRVIANAANLQITDRASIVLRLLAALRAGGVEHALAMPENGGIGLHVRRGIERERQRGETPLAALTYLDLPVTGTAADTVRAAAALRQKGVAAILVLGGDGTHRAAASAAGEVPIAGISTGTNNAFPEAREPTIVGLAVALAVTGAIPAEIAFAANKRLTVEVNDGAQREVALVDVAIVGDRYVGARALWRTDSFRELFTAFAEPTAIGMSAIAGLLEPVPRDAPYGLAVRLAPPETATLRLTVPIAPGYLREIGIETWWRLAAGETVRPATRAGSLALDGERELAFDERDTVCIRLEENAFRTVDVAACMRYAARRGLLRRGTAAELHKIIAT